jgi:hypothetical protein
MEEKEAFMEKLQAETANWEDLKYVVKFNQIKEMIKSEFIKLESKSGWIQIWILYISRYFCHNIQLKYWIQVIPMTLES